MGKFLKQYKKELEKEVTQFLFLCGEEDGRILVLQDKNSTELVRLSCIALAFGYIKLFMKIATVFECNVEDFLNNLGQLDGNFSLIDKWVSAFFENIGHEKAQALTREFWLERKVELSSGDFKIKNLLDL